MLRGGIRRSSSGTTTNFRSLLSTICFSRFERYPDSRQALTDAYWDPSSTAQALLFPSSSFINPVRPPPRSCSEGLAEWWEQERSTVG